MYLVPNVDVSPPIMRIAHIHMAKVENNHNRCKKNVHTIDVNWLHFAIQV